MDLNALLQQARAARGNTNSVILKAGEPAGHAPWEMFVTEEHTEHYLALKAGGETYRGMATGVLGGITLCGFTVFAILFALKGDWDGVLISMGIIACALLVPFLWEISQPLPLPILLNRRTRELYYQHDGELYHMPWDEARALACEFLTVGPQSGGMGHASLEIPVRRYGDTQQVLLLSLTPPIGKTLDMQRGFWAWLQAYMDNGPWFDEHGQRSESDRFVREMIEAGSLRLSDNLARNWRIIRRRESNGFSDGPGPSDFAIFIYFLVFLPVFKLQDFTYDIAKRCSRGQWPSLVTERLRPGGPTTRLVDLERAQGLAV